MKQLPDPNAIENAFRRVGELLRARGHQYHIVVIGGSAVNLLGFRSRATTDVDILAFASPDARGGFHLRPPDEPLPQPLVEAAQTVAVDLGLDPNWLNTGPASQWQTGLPPGLEERVAWRSYGNLWVGVVARRDLIFFKLYAAADNIRIPSVHYQDLLAFAPTDAELAEAASWIHSRIRARP